jgi:uncharacterized protein
MRSIIVALALLLPLSVNAGVAEGLEAISRGDYVEAMKHFKPVAEQGDAEAQELLGVLYRYGRGVKIDHVEAGKWFLMAANQGNSEAQLYLGLMYQNGEGVQRDLATAHMWLTLSAQNPKTTHRDSLYRQRDVRNLERRMNEEQIARAKEMAQNWKPSN